MTKVGRSHFSCFPLKPGLPPIFALLFSLLFFTGLALPAPARAQQTLAGSGPFALGKAEVGDALASAWNIEAEKLSHDQERQLFEAEGSVRLSSGTRLIEADRGALDMVNRKAELWGNVSIQYGRNWLRGEHVIWNLDTETGWLDSGVIFFAENNFYVQGYSIAKTGPNQFELKEGFVTSCNPAEPEWRFQYRNMTVDTAGTAWAKDVSMWASGMPVLYIPIVGVPVNRARQSGFLIPWAGYSDLTGFDFEIPYYLAFRDDMDATFYARYMDKRGFMAGAEYRINNRQWGEGVWQFNYIRDQADKDFLASEGFPFQTKDRYWIRGRHNVDLPWDIEARIDVDFVSDRYFLHEFKNGSTSTVQDDRIFRQYFGRGLLHDTDSLVRESTIYLEKHTESSLLSMDARYFQQLQENMDENTIQRLPSFTYSILPQWIGNTPFYYTLDSSAVNYWREEGDKDQRIDIYPRAYMPLHWKNYIDVEPSVGFRSTSYVIDWNDKNFDNYTQRAVSDAKVEMSSRLNKVYPVSLGSVMAIQHSIRPEVSYEYATQATQGRSPHLDRLDEDQSRNGVRYGFSTFLTTKQMVPDAEGNMVPSYREWARLRMFQFFNVQKPAVDDPLFTTRILDDGPSPVGVRFDLMPQKYITFSYDADLDWLGTGEGNAHDMFMTLDSGKGHILRVDYQLRDDLGINEITTEAFIQILSNVYLNAYHDYSIDQSILFRQGYGIRYYRGCWGIGFAFERDGEDNRFVFSIDLLGIGNIGSGNMRYMGKTSFDYQPEYQRPEMYKLAK
ncbi:MAG: LPS assembly protein LptD [Syntrophobacter sp.]